MVNTATLGMPGLLPQEYTGRLLLAALRESTLALDARCATLLVTPNISVHLPVLSADAAGSWTPEGSEITASEPTLQELVVTPAKVANIAVISTEAADDSSPQAAQVIGQSLAQGLGNTIDKAFFGGATPNGPSGLASLTGITSISAGTAWANLDPFADAMAAAEAHGTVVTAFVGSYADVASLSKLKTAKDWNEPLLGEDATQASGRTIFGVPLVASSKATTGTMWALAANRIMTVVRHDVIVEQSTDALFSSDRVVLRGKARVGFAWLQPAALSKISIGSGT